jgi:hypothetical protein
MAKPAKALRPPTNFASQKRMAAEIMGCGRSKVVINPFRENELKGATTRAQIRALIKEGVIARRVTKPHLWKLNDFKPAPPKEPRLKNQENSTSVPEPSV